MITLALLVAVATPKLLVLDFKDDGVGEDVVRVIHDTLTTHVSNDARVDVVSTEDMRRMVEVASDKAAIGCNDQSCLAELADAMGAQYLLYGNAGKLGALYVINVSLYDAVANTTVGRQNVEAAQIEQLPAGLRAAGDALLARLPARARPDAPIAAEPDPLPSPLLLAGAGVGALGVVGAAGGLIVFGVSKAALASAPTFEEKSSAQLRSNVGLTVAGVAAVIALAGGALVGVALLAE
jgi:hypothetical protein